MFGTLAMTILTYVFYLSVVYWNDQALTALFYKIEKLECYKCIFNTIQDSVMIFDNNKIELVNTRFKELFDEQIKKS